MHKRCGDGSARAIDNPDERVVQNIPVMTFPIKKRSNTDLFINRKQGVYIQNGIKKTF